MKLRSFFSRRIFLFILILALSSEACTISLLKWATPAPVSTSIPSGPTPTPLPRAQVTFTVRVPDPLQPNEILAISVVDEVTGLALNAVDYQVAAVDPITYS